MKNRFSGGGRSAREKEIDGAKSSESEAAEKVAFFMKTFGALDLLENGFFDTIFPFVQNSIFLFDQYSKNKERIIFTAQAIVST